MAAACTAYSAWAALDTTQALPPTKRVSDFAARVRNNSLSPANRPPGPPDTSAEGDTGGRMGASRATGKALYEAITRVRETGDNPTLLADMMRVLAKADHDPKDVLHIGLQGDTTARPDRRSSVLTRMMCMRVLHAATVDQRLSAVSNYSWAHGGAYLGEAVGDALVKNGLATAQDVKFLKLDALFAAFCGFKWKHELDLYNLLLVEIVKQVQCGGTLGDVPVEGVPFKRVYADALLNARLPILAAAAFKAMGLPYEGDTSFRGLLESSNAFVLMNGGITAASTRGAARRDSNPPTHALPREA